MYSCGLRTSEARTLKVKSIDSGRMVLRIIGKGNKESLIPFPETLLEPMRAFWKTHCNHTWLSLQPVERILCADKPCYSLFT